MSTHNNNEPETPPKPITEEFADALVSYVEAIVSDRMDPGGSQAGMWTWSKERDLREVIGRLLK